MLCVGSPASSTLSIFYHTYAIQIMDIGILFKLTKGFSSHFEAYLFFCGFDMLKQISAMGR